MAEDLRQPLQRAPVQVSGQTLDCLLPLRMLLRVEKLCWCLHENQPSVAHPVATLCPSPAGNESWAKALLSLASLTALSEPWPSSKLHVPVRDTEAAVPVVLWEPGVCRPVPDEDFFLVVELLDGVDVPGGGGGGDGISSGSHTPVPLQDVPIGQTCVH